MVNTCAWCKWYSYNVCVRHAPIVMPIPPIPNSTSVYTITKWPEVHSNSYCGDFEKEDEVR